MRRRSLTRGVVQRRDVAAGLVVALVLLLVGPGLGMIAVIAIVVIAIVGASYAVERAVRRRRTRDP